MPAASANPIFIVSSGRSGSTILTWCLGQHPNILPQEESNWLGPFAVHTAVDYRLGAMRGERGQLSANFISREDLLQAFGDTIDKLIVSRRGQFENVDLRRTAGWAPPPFPVSRSTNEPKARWVDGTPEYSLYICALRKLFPRAVFIHLVRDVRDVVRSLLNFYGDGANRLVETEQAAYEYWLRRATACGDAERAYGSGVVYRLRYVDLATEPEQTMRLLFRFLDEPYAAACLEPLQLRINSSKVPADFDEREADTDPAVVARARRLSDELLGTPQPEAASAEAAAKLEAQFDERVDYLASLEGRPATSASTQATGARRSVE